MQINQNENKIRSYSRKNSETLKGKEDLSLRLCLSPHLSVRGRRGGSCFSTTCRSRDGFPPQTGNASSPGRAAER